MVNGPGVFAAIALSTLFTYRIAVGQDIAFLAGEEIGELVGSVGVALVLLLLMISFATGGWMEAGMIEYAAQ